MVGETEGSSKVQAKAPELKPGWATLAVKMTVSLKSAAKEGPHGTTASQRLLNR